MKKLLVSALSVLTFGFVVSPSETRATENLTTVLTANASGGQIGI